MNANAINRFFKALSSILEIERGQLYQLIQSADTSYWLRDVKSQHEIGLALQSFAYPFNQIGKYYESIFLYRTGEYARAKELLETVAESAPSRYRSRALLSLSAVEESLGRFEESLILRLSASTNDDPVNLLQAKHGVAVLHGLQGEHQAALRDLERLLPLAFTIGKRGHPAYFAFLNSYALELSETGKDDQAQQAVNVLAASPFISRYQEWQETVEGVMLKQKSRSVVAAGLPQDPRIRKAIEFMHANLSRKISLNDMARVVNLAPSSLSQLFKRQTRLPPCEYLIGLRMNKSRELLTKRDLSIKQVMAETGYDTRSNFLRHFKRHFGIAPLRFRKRR